MPYEYIVYDHSMDIDGFKGDLYKSHSGSAIKTMDKVNLELWLNEMGAQGWRLQSFHADIDSPIIFEREIATNETLRGIQLGIQPEKEQSENDKK